MALFYQRHFHTLYFMSSPHAMLWVLLPYFSHTQNHHINYRTWRFIGPQQPGRVWSINWLLYWAGRGNGASSLWWSPPSLWNRWEKRRVLEVERKDSTILSDLISIWFYSNFLVKLHKFEWLLWFLVPCRTRFNISMPGQKIIIAVMGTKNHHFKRVCWEPRRETRPSLRML